MDKFDTVIVGAGPGGLRCAKILAEAGKDVLVLEKSPELFRKICTGIWGITPKTEKLNLPEKVFGRKFNKLLFFERGNSQDFQMESDFCATLDRKKLSDWQLEESEKAGAKIWFGSNVKKILEDKIELRGG